jgi:hypothetical protein
MKDSKLIGLIATWGYAKWARLAVEQALEYCDEVLAVVTSFTPESEKFEDNSYDVIKGYPDVRLLDVKRCWSTIYEGMPVVLNHMLKHSKLFVPGNWVWQLDSDEFYPKAAYEEVRAVIKEDEYDKIAFEEKYFFINMQYYLEGIHDGRLMRVESGLERFKPTCRWSRRGGKIYTISRRTGMFHYSLLRDMRMMRQAWLTEYPGGRQRGRNKAVRWLDEVYANYDLENEDYWNKKSFEVRGHKNPSWTHAVKPDENGRLFRYNGEHPRVIEESGFTKIKDFRKC